MVERLGVDQPADRLAERDAGAEEDRQHDEEPGAILAARAAQEERDPRAERRSAHRRSCGSGRRAARRCHRATKTTTCARVVKRSTTRRDRDRPDTGTGPDDRRVDQPVTVPWPPPCVCSCSVLSGPRAGRRSGVPASARRSSSSCCRRDRRRDPFAGRRRTSDPCRSVLPSSARRSKARRPDRASPSAPETLLELRSARREVDDDTRPRLRAELL